MTLYKNYCDRRIAQKKQELNDIPCCPTRIPIIGPLLFSLLIFSPFILSSSGVDSDSEVTSNESIEERLLSNDQSFPILEISAKARPTSLQE